MKKLWILVMMLLFCVLCVEAQNRHIRKFYRKYKKKENVENIVLPGFVIRTGGMIARWVVKEPEEKQALKLLKKMKGVRVLTDDHGQHIGRNDVRLLAARLNQSKRFEPLMMVREKGAVMYLFGRLKGEKIKQIVVLTHEEGGATLVSVKARLKMKHLNQFLRMMQDDFDLPEEVVPAEAPPKPKVPQA